VVLNNDLKGRWQVMSRSPLTICDTAHNEAGLSMVLSQISTLNYKKIHFVFGMVEDKELKKILSMLPKEATYYFCKPKIPRGLDQKVLASKASRLGLAGRTYLCVKDALYAAKYRAKADDLIIITGSTFVVAEVV
jgi:dihydrofolate synthase/folylpolyglutamate synthase